MISKTLRVLMRILIFLGLCNGAAGAQDFYQIPGVIHVHSTFSSGQHSVEALAAMAQEKGMGVIILTDHDLTAMEYGILPFRNLIKKREERNSILKSEPENYLAEIARVNQKRVRGF